jgi:hypothetical protein
MSQREFTPPRMQGYSIASLLLMVSLAAAGLALLRSGVANGMATKDRMLIAALVVGGGGLGSVIGLVIGAVSPHGRLGVPVSIIAGGLAGGFCGSVMAVNIWFPMFLVGGVVVCIVAGIINLTRRRTGPPPPPQAARGGSPFASPPRE